MGSATSSLTHQPPLLATDTCLLPAHRLPHGPEGSSDDALPLHARDVEGFLYLYASPVSVQGIVPRSVVHGFRGCVMRGGIQRR